jgi:hypothetical protein
LRVVSGLATNPQIAPSTSMHSPCGPCRPRLHPHGVVMESGWAPAVPGWPSRDTEAGRDPRGRGHRGASEEEGEAFSDNY